jgi:4-hydroxybenzoate polyprenyltransferase
MSVAETSQSPVHVARTVAADIKLAHSVFALPFALLAAVMAAEQHFVLPADPDEAFWPGLWLLGRMAGPLLLIMLAMFCARTVAMLANRIIDREIDARNPRTAGRALPSGRLSTSSAFGVLLLCAAGFMAACVAFGVQLGNWWPAILGLPVLIWISAYAWLKRFTVLCHLYLGSSLAISPLAAAIAIDPATLGDQPALWLIALMVLCWVAGFDIIYALQDVAVDRDEGLHSIPSRLGERGGLWVSRLLHVVAAGCLIGAVRVDARLELMFAIGVAIVIALLVVEHVTVAKWRTARIALTFFTLNGVISCVLGGLGITDVLI